MNAEELNSPTSTANIKIKQIPGLLITTLVIAGFMYFLMFYLQNFANWTFSVCLLFGSILSATDPVAVVALLRELGAPHQLVVITEGESLFNDGAAIIAYEIFLLLVERDLNPSGMRYTILGINIFVKTCYYVCLKHTY